MIKIKQGDATKFITEVEESSVSSVITDPPYFIDKMGDDWDNEKLKEDTDQSETGTVDSLPPGMKMDSSQGRQLYDWYLDFSKDVYNAIKPGGFFLSFSSPRLSHRMACAVEDAGFMIRDQFYWLYTKKTQPKAMTLLHFLEDEKNISEEKLSALQDWKTPQVKKNVEPIIFAQKPYEKTYLNNFIKHDVGLINSEAKLGDDKFPSNFLQTEGTIQEMDKHFLVQKPEKEDFNTHLTVKPVSLIRHLINLLSYSKEDVILDPFMGSGTTAVAALKEDRSFMGFEIDDENIGITERRVKKAKNQRKQKKQFFDFE